MEPITRGVVHNVVIVNTTRHQENVMEADNYVELPAELQEHPFGRSSLLKQ